MAKGLSRQELLALARAGAEARIVELQGQIDAIRRTFGARLGFRLVRIGVVREIMADAAKRRWAKWRAEKKK